MSYTVTGVPPDRQVRRVRHQAQELLALMAFSAATSVVLTGVALLVLGLGRQG